MINSSVFELLAKREIVLESALSLYARLVEMDTLLRSVPGLPLRRYAEQNGISLRTAQRYLATLAAIVGDIRPLRIPGAEDQHAVHWYVGPAPHLVEIASGLVSRKEPSPLASADVQTSQQAALWSEQWSSEMAADL
jgi:hypothetical protein